MSNNNENENKKATSSLYDKDTVWDARLDWLRENPMPPVVEVIVAWIMALLCLTYYAYSYLSLTFKSTKKAANTTSAHFFPLVVQVKGQEETRTTKEMYQELQPHLKDAKDDDERLVARIRNSLTLRRLVTALFQQTNVDLYVSDVERWRRLWPRLMALPPVLKDDKTNATAKIALILPAYKEDGHRLLRTLKVAIDHCLDPSQLQIIVVNAGHCPNLQVVQDFFKSLAKSSSFSSSWRIVDYTGGGGRGPTLDNGTQHVDEDISLLTFLHSDTLLPQNWDKHVRKTWTTVRQGKNQKIVTATAFLFNQDKSEDGLNGGPYPWGIEAVQLLGNVRAWALSLPYGDHVLSMPLAYYRYVGGFPHQPIMEDYQLMDYFRQRARWQQRQKQTPRESISILPAWVHTGVRRWQSHGVVYVTLVNALIVYRYQLGWTPTEIFRYYYQRPNNEKKSA